MKRHALLKKMRASLLLCLLLADVAGSACRAGERGSIAGIGVLGDSYSDEYQFYPPDRSLALNWVEILRTARGLNLGRYTTESRGEPRNQGYEFNWARSDATTTDLIQNGQHTGLAAQVARGDVNVVVIFVGGNDFIYALHSHDAAAIVQPVLSRALSNLQCAVETILQASSDVQVLVATLPSILDLPEFTEPLQRGQISATLGATYSKAIERYNQRIRALPLSSPRVAVLDLALIARLAPRPDADHVRVCGLMLDRSHPSNRTEHVFLGDSRHVGTLVQSVMANLVIHTLNARMGARVEPIGTSEILDMIRAPAKLVRRDSAALNPKAGLAANRGIPSLKLQRRTVLAD
jgi:hypothetical protein